MTRDALQKRVQDLEEALRPFAELVKNELSDPRYPPGSMGYHNETDEADASMTTAYVKHGWVRRAARLLSIPIPKLSAECLAKVPKYCPEPIKHNHHLNMHCHRCGELHCHEYYHGAKAVDPDLTYYTCLGCKAVVGYSPNDRSPGESGR